MTTNDRASPGTTTSSSAAVRGGSRARAVGVRVTQIAVGLALLLGAPLSLGDPFSAIFYVAYAGVGWWLVARRPDHAIGWLLILVAVGFAATTPTGLDPVALASGEADAVSWFRAWWSTWGASITFLGFLGIALTFPSGRLPPGRWRAPVIGGIVFIVVATILVAVRPTFDLAIDGGPDIIVTNRLAVAPDAPIWSVIDAIDDLIFVFLFAFLAIAIIGMFVRYSRSEGIVRLQLRWLVAALAAILTTVIFAIVASSVVGEVAGIWIPAVIAYLLVPLSIGVAISRYRLFEIDRIISRTIGWSLVSGLLVAAFAILVVGLQAALANVTQGESLAVAASTLVAFALFQPVRRTVQRAVDRRFDRSRYDAQLTVDAFAERLRDEVDLDTLAGELERTVSGAIRPTAASLWLPGRES